MQIRGFSRHYFSGVALHGKDFCKMSTTTRGKIALFDWNMTGAADGLRSELAGQYAILVGNYHSQNWNISIFDSREPTPGMGTLPFVEQIVRSYSNASVLRVPDAQNQHLIERGSPEDVRCCRISRLLHRVLRADNYTPARVIVLYTTSEPLARRFGIICDGFEYQYACCLFASEGTAMEHIYTNCDASTANPTMPIKFGSWMPDAQKSASVDSAQVLAWAGRVRNYCDDMTEDRVCQAGENLPEDWRDFIAWIFRICAPEKLANLDRLAERYAGAEFALLMAVVRKYEKIISQKAAFCGAQTAHLSAESAAQLSVQVGKDEPPGHSST
jgi:hypothetical protein